MAAELGGVLAELDGTIQRAREFGMSEIVAKVSRQRDCIAALVEAARPFSGAENPDALEDEDVVMIRSTRQCRKLTTALRGIE